MSNTHVFSEIDDLAPPNLRTQVLNSMYTFPSPYWDDVSDEAVDLIQVLLAQNTEDRHTVDDALEHVWMTMEVPYAFFFLPISPCFIVTLIAPPHSNNAILIGNKQIG